MSHNFGFVTIRSISCVELDNQFFFLSWSSSGHCITKQTNITQPNLILYNKFKTNRKTLKSIKNWIYANLMHTFFNQISPSKSGCALDSCKYCNIYFQVQLSTEDQGLPTDCWYHAHLSAYTDEWSSSLFRNNVWSPCWFPQIFSFHHNSG